MTAPGFAGACPPLMEGHVCFRTSGTEGGAKWVALSWRALRASALAVNAHLHGTAADRWLRVLPVWHVGGFQIHTRAAESGAAVVADEARWDAGRFAERCGAERITLSSLVPAQVFDLVKAGLPAPDSLRAVVVGGGALRSGLWERARGLGWPLLTSYGMTEAGSQVATMPLGGTDPEALEILPLWQMEAAADGRLRLRGDGLMTCYLRDEDGAGWVREEPGVWFATQDRGTVQGGVLRFLGRTGQAVKILGELVNVATLQDRLEEVAEGLGLDPRHWALRAVPDERAEHRLVLEAPPGVDETRVRGIFEAGVAGYEAISEVRRVAWTGGKLMPEA